MIKFSTFEKFRDLFYKNSGIYLKDHKIYLIENRLQKYINKYKLDNYDEYYKFIINNSNKNVLVEFVNSLTTNYSYFYRDPVHFRFLEYYLKYKIKDKKLRIWSAGCSTGQEAYTISLMFNKFSKHIPIDSKILASDISTTVLDKAINGKFERTKVEPYVSNEELEQFFRIIDEKYIEVKERLKRFITFRKLNLLSPFPFDGKFDIIFLRNVMIYFDKQEKDKIINKLYNYIKDDGYLILGLSETISEIKTPFITRKYSIYKK